MLTKRCLILQERQAGDAGRFLDILTKTEGVLEVFVRGSKKANSKHLAATQPFAYSKLCLAEKNGRYYVESAEPIHLFYGLREHLTQLALAAYFFDLIRYAVPTGQQQNFILRLTLNTLYYLTTGNRSEAFLKSVFELRFLSELGMMPDVLVCPVCMEYLPQSLFYSARTGHFYCQKCYTPKEEDYAVRTGTPLSIPAGCGNTTGSQSVLGNLCSLPTGLPTTDPAILQTAAIHTTTPSPSVLNNGQMTNCFPKTRRHYESKRTYIRIR